MDNVLINLRIDNLDIIPVHLRKFFEPVYIEHFAVFPEALVEIPIKFGCPKGGIVLDPFMGSGTTAIVAKKLGRNYLGIELNPDYIKIAEARIKVVQTPLL